MNHPFTRALVIGCPGAGKSTFARGLRDATGIPLVYLDMIWHKPDGTNVSPEEFDQRLAEKLARERWIIDGNYLRTLPERLKRCDAVFSLDLPAEECLAAARGRIGQPREDLPWRETEFDPEFGEYILRFPTDQRPKLLALLDAWRDDRAIVTFRSHDEANRYLARIAEAQGHADVRAWQVEPLATEDLAAAAKLFCETVHAVNARDYTPDQLRAWAPGDATHRARLAETLAAEYAVGVKAGGKLVGFGSLDGEARELDLLYVHRDHQGEGIGRAIVRALEREARARGWRTLRTFASLTARPFFERMGYKTVRPNTVVRTSVELVNYLMEKPLEKSPASPTGTCVPADACARSQKDSYDRENI